MYVIIFAGEKMELLFLKENFLLKYTEQCTYYKGTAQIFYPLEFSQAKHTHVTSIKMKKQDITSSSEVPLCC